MIFPAFKGIVYGARLKEAGVPTDVQVVARAYHGYDYERHGPLVKRMLTYRSKVMKTMFAS